MDSYRPDVAVELCGKLSFNVELQPTAKKRNLLTVGCKNLLCLDFIEAYPRINFDGFTQPGIEQGGYAMIPIKDFESISRECKCNWCAKTTCRENASFVPSSALPTIFGITTDCCPNILYLITDDEVDIVFRYWVKHIFIEKKFLSTPFKLRELLKSKGVKDSMPVSVKQVVLDAFEWPSDILDERRKKVFANSRR